MHIINLSYISHHFFQLLSLWLSSSAGLRFTGGFLLQILLDRDEIVLQNGCCCFWKMVFVNSLQLMLNSVQLMVLIWHHNLDTNIARLVEIPVQISKNQIWIANHQIPMNCKVQNIKQTLNIKISNIKHNYNKTIIFLPQSTPSVCCGHPVRQLDWTTPAGGDLDDLSFWWFRSFVSCLFLFVFVLW